LDRLYVHAYMPKPQTSGGLWYFLRDHLGYPIPSPALFTPMHDRLIAAIKTYATTPSSAGTGKTTWRRRIARAGPWATASS
jgi:hypothetical protein